MASDAAKNKTWSIMAFLRARLTSSQSLMLTLNNASVIFVNPGVQIDGT